MAYNNPVKVVGNILFILAISIDILMHKGKLGLIMKKNVNSVFNSQSRKKGLKLFSLTKYTAKKLSILFLF